MIMLIANNVENQAVYSPLLSFGDLLYTLTKNIQKKKNV